MLLAVRMRQVNQAYAHTVRGYDCSKGSFRTAESAAFLILRSHLNHDSHPHGPKVGRRPYLVVFMAAQAPETETYGPARITKGRRDVVTGFVQRPSDGSILVLQRSDKISTYPLKWGGVSGVVEGSESLVERAFQEITEELGFERECVEFQLSGRPLYIDDGTKHFAVHPMLFSVTSTGENREPQMNWENEGYTWVKPDELKSLDAVPMLKETWERVSLTPKQQQAINALALNRTKGAAELAYSGLQQFEEESAYQCKLVGELGDGVEVLETLKNWGYHLATCRPSMAPLANAIAETLVVVHDELHARADAFEASSGEVCFALSKAVEAEHARLRSIADNLCSNAAALLQDGTTVMTISYSSTILRAVKAAHAAGRSVKVIVCESRPLFEGVSLAQQWKENGIDVTVITDAQAAVFMPQTDVVLVGADAVLRSAVVNKVGTHLLALAAAAAGKKIYAAADTTKLSPGSLFNLAHPGGIDRQFHEEKSVKEISAAWPEDVQITNIRNVYFEDVPLSLFTGVVTERGMLEPEEVEKEVVRLGKLHKVAFTLD